MGKALRKPRPSPPRWYWIESDNCYRCKNRNNCNQCKILKRKSAYEKKNKTRKELAIIRKELQI